MVNIFNRHPIVKKIDRNVFALIVVATATVATLLLAASKSADLVIAHSRNSMNLTATMERSSNQFTKKFDVKTFEFSTTDKAICTGGTCTYTIKKGCLDQTSLVH
ncbi:MAG: hypothetical protein DLM72_05275 [Candidatus Nitrosopolaris wilkensis]|nr:MAG: hypothetical protein DLM72_05275 [Candidatus Nitrosopolaris wilkensis]